MPFIAPIIGIVSAVAGVAGSLAQGGAQSAAANYQAQVATNNAILAGEQATMASQAGYEQTAEKSLQGAQQLGQIKAAMGANNVDINTGSNVNVIGSQRAASQLASQTVQANAQKAVFGYQNQQQQYADQANLYKAQAQSDQTAGMIGAATHIIGGLGSVVSGGGFGGGTGLFGSSSATAAPFDTSDLDLGMQMGY